MSFRRILSALALVSTVALAGAPARAAESVAALAGWNRGEAYHRLYDPAREVVVPGHVLEIARFVPQAGMAEGVHAYVDAGREKVWVELGPAVFVDAQPLQLAVGDAVTVTGALVTRGDDHVVLASVVTKDGKSLKFRSASGDPAWSKFKPGTTH